MNKHIVFTLLIICILLFSVSAMGENTYLVGPKVLYEDNKGGVYQGPSVVAEKYRIKVAPAGTEGEVMPEEFTVFEPYTFENRCKYLITIRDKEKLSITVEKNPSVLDYYPVPQDDPLLYFNNETGKGIWYGIQLVFYSEKEGFTGVWSGSSIEGEFKEIWCINHVSATWKVRGKYYSGDKLVGEFNGENVKLENEKLYFKQVFSSLPCDTWAKVYNIEASLDGDTIIYKWNTGLEEGQNKLYREKE